MAKEKAAATAEAAVIGKRKVRVSKPKEIEFVVDNNIKMDSLYKAIEQAVKQYGCTGCGLGGLDIRFRARDELVIRQFKEIPGIHDIALHS